MNTYLVVMGIILLHLIIYSIPPIIGIFLDETHQISLSYVYIGMLFTLLQLFDNLYAINLTADYSLFGGDIAYSALIFTALVLVFTQPKPEVVRHLIYFAIIVSVFLFLLFGLIHYLLATDYVTNFIDLSMVYTEYSLQSLLLTLTLFSSEIILIMILIKKLGKLTHSRNTKVLAAGVVYNIVIMLDGILYPLLKNALSSSSTLSVVNGIVAKLIFGIGFGVILVSFLSVRYQYFTQFLSTEAPLKLYFIPPNDELKKQLVEAELRINQLESIVPICSWCHKIRNDAGYWDELEAYLKKSNGMTFSHGICENCSTLLTEEEAQES